MKVIRCKTASWRTPPSWRVYVKVYTHHDTTKMTYMRLTTLATRHYNHVILTSGYTGIMTCHHQDMPTLSYTCTMTYHHHDIVALGHTVIIPHHYHDIPTLSHTGNTTQWHDYDIPNQVKFPATTSILCHSEQHLYTAARHPVICNHSRRS